jgi:hypothetical protein
MSRIFAMLILSMATAKAFSQTTLNFCTSVEKEYCYFNNTQFIAPIDSSQSLIFMLVKNPSGFGTSKLKFDIYSIDKATNKELLINSLVQVVESDWDWVWKSDLFKSPGRYKVKVINHLDGLLVEKSFEIFLPKK